MFNPALEPGQPEILLPGVVAGTRTRRSRDLGESRMWRVHHWKRLARLLNSISVTPKNSSEGHPALHLLV